MHFIRKIEQDRTDVRSRSYFVYKCGLCGHDEWYNWVPNFDTARLRECPKCGVVEDIDEKTRLLQRKQILEQKMQPYLDELRVIDSRLVELEPLTFGQKYAKFIIPEGK